MPISAKPTNSRVAVLSSRRSGAAGVCRLLSDYLSAEDLGKDPFAWSGALRQISIDFYDGFTANARIQMLDALARGPFFLHHFDIHSPQFNNLLVDSLQDCGYKIVYFIRNNLAQQLFSLIVAQYFDSWSQQEIQLLRSRMIDGTLCVQLGDDLVPRTIKHHKLSLEAIESNIRILIPSPYIMSFESLYRDGIGALKIIDDLFKYCGLTSRASLITDASLLLYLHSGEHYTSALAQYSTDLQRLLAVLVNFFQSDRDFEPDTISHSFDQTL
jgi:hypothetical protein